MSDNFSIAGREKLSQERINEIVNQEYDSKTHREPSNMASATQDFKFIDKEMALCVYEALHRHQALEDDDRDDELISSLYELFEIEPL